MKIAIAGKGGVGKTTLAALLAQAYAEKGKDVLAVDADPSPCLANALGFPQELIDGLQPISRMDELIEERTGAKPGTVGGFFTINPKVDDIPDRFSITNKNVRLLVMGEVDTGGTGCICPESALLKTLFTHLLFRDDEILILDMYAGVEHLGRATVDFVDALIIVVEPTRRSLGTAKQIKTLANDIGLNKIWLVGNKIESHDDEFFIGNNSLEIPVLGLLSNDRKVMEADRLNIPVYRHSVQLRRECIILADKLVNLT